MTVKQAGAMGGKARAAKETSDQRKERMRLVATARWIALGHVERKIAMKPALKARWNGRRKNKAK